MSSKVAFRRNSVSQFISRHKRKACFDFKTQNTHNGRTRVVLFYMRRTQIKKIRLEPPRPFFNSCPIHCMPLSLFVSLLHRRSRWLTLLTSAAEGGRGDPLSRTVILEWLLILYLCGSAPKLIMGIEHEIIRLGLHLIMRVWASREFESHDLLRIILLMIA